MIEPGATIGIIGGGQLGKMLAVAAAQLGYRCHIYAPESDPPAARVSDTFTRAPYDSVEQLLEFAERVDVVTYEFENLPAKALLAFGSLLRPGTLSLEIAQDRLREKRFIEQLGGRVAPWMPIDSAEDASRAESELGLPLVVKTRRLGYDGKGQAWARSPGSAPETWVSVSFQPAVAEAAVAFDAEFSVLLARSESGEIAVWDTPLNQHENGILRRSTVPAGEAVESCAPAAVALARAIADELRHIGVLTVEFFATADGPIVNEIAPRVHNSGHWTIEGAATSQFEQHIRAVCGLPLGATDRLTASAMMENLLGDDVLRWPELVAERGAHLHLYGKGAPRPGRKMGHVTRLTTQSS